MKTEPDVATRSAASWLSRAGSSLALLSAGALSVAVLLTLINFTGSAQADVQVKLVPGSGAQSAPKARGLDVLPVAAKKAGTGSVEGTILFDGPVPVPALLVKKGDGSVKDAAVCAAEDIPDQSLVVNKESKGIANVFIYLQKPPAGYKAEKPAEPNVVFDQKGCHFIPHGLLVEVGQTVLVKSGDPIGHNTHTFPLRNDGFNQLIKPEDRDGAPLVYKKPEKLPLQVKCDLHPWMVAYHLVLDHPFMAVTDKDGKFSIHGLPPGSHKFVVWQEKKGYLNRELILDVKADKSTPVKVSYNAKSFESAAFEGPRPKSVSVSLAP